MEMTYRNQAGLALEDPNDGLPLDSRKGLSLGERLGCLDDLDPIIKVGMGSEENQIIVNADKGNHLLWDEL